MYSQAASLIRNIDRTMYKYESTHFNQRHTVEYVTGLLYVVYGLLCVYTDTYAGISRGAVV